MLTTQADTLAKIHETIHNYQPMSWLLISSDDFVSDKRIDALKNGKRKSEGVN